MRRVDYGEKRRFGPLLRARHEAEYLLLRGVYALSERLPIAAASGLAVGLADLGYLLLSGRRRIATDNIVRSSLGVSGQEARRIVRASFRHFALSGLETFKMQPRFRDGSWQECVRVVRGKDILERLRSRNEGLLLAGAHFGNWEIGGHAFAMYRPVTAVARRMDNPKADAFIAQRRFSGRIRGIPKHDRNPRRLLHILRDGQVLAIMMDQHAGRHGIPVEFLGRPASTYPSLARLSAATGAPVYMGLCRRAGRLRYEIEVLGPIECPKSGDREGDARALLTLLHAELEARIRSAPEQYLWGHRRWRLD